MDEFAELIALTNLQDNNGNYDLPQTFFQAASDLIVDEDFSWISIVWVSQKNTVYLVSFYHCK